MLIEIFPKDAASLANAIFLDVREPREREVAYIPGSLHVPFGRLKHTPHPLPSPLRGEGGGKEKVVVYCASGCRSLKAVKKLKKMGYKNAVSLKGGIQAWQEAGLPVASNPPIPPFLPKADPPLAEIKGGKGGLHFLSNEKILRYARQLVLPEVGIEGQKRLASAKVLIIGAGGLGSPAAIYLAAAGVGTIGIVDNDRVELENLHRQILHTTPRLGKKKTASVKETIRALNPHVVVKPYNERLTKRNSRRIFKGFDIIVDGSDNFPTRYVANEACVKLGLPLVHGSILRFTGQVGVFCGTPPHPPLKVRGGACAPPLKIRGGGGSYKTPCYACLYPQPPPPDVAPTCAEAGVLGVIPGIIGTMQALEALKLILKFGEPLIGKLLIFDGLACKMKTLEVGRDVGCKVCSLVR